MIEQTEGIRSFQDLRAWQEAHKLALAIYTLSQDFPKQEIFGLTSQMRRAAVSVTSNIAEGFSRQTINDKLHFYTIAFGSLTELQSQMLLVKDLGFGEQERCQKVSEQIVTAQKILSGFISSTKKRRT